ncbi:MAG: ATP-grasp domain-containing protein [Acidobacteriota bacterium]|nr:ATP-grasp domain-containing protein [Acidobacteriota bacterium]
MFDSVLVANRGEVAVRVIATLRRLGVRSVAVFSDEDRDARHVREADVALHLGATPAHESYLNIERVLDAVARSGAQAVHPGYGFLAENADFVRACDDAGVVFIGPSADSVELMGDKIRAKSAVAANGVAVVPGRAQAAMDDDDLVAAAAEIGYPVLVKPSAGGGGKGMRLVAAAADLMVAIASSRREAMASFGDDTLFIERFVERPRHLEVQILADHHGHAIHLGERECSLQRRHQKVIEEAPSPLLDEATRERLCAAALRVGAVTDYRGVGTVEFIVSQSRPDEFYFMEMNTRLQVEHPVTEMVFGVDLVEQQLRVAAGESLSLTQDDLRPRGHAVEARVYAEDPSRDFVPTGGDLLFLREPAATGVRVDSSLVAGTRVGISYDPMVAKVIAHGEDRDQALARLDGALGDLVTLGVGTNTTFLRHLLADGDVRRGVLDTELIARAIERGADFEAEDEGRLARRAAAVAVAHLVALAPRATRYSRFDVPDGWRVGAHSSTTLAFLTPENGAIELRVRGDVAAAQVFVGDDAEPVEVRTLEWAALSRDVTSLLISVDGRVTRSFAAARAEGTWLWQDGASTLWRPRGPVRADASHDAHDGEVRSPMPGVVIELTARPGGDVAPGDTLVVVEAMKMEYALVAPFAGRVDEVLVTRGDQVVLDQVTVRVRRHASDATASRSPTGPDEEER